ncbi:arginine repressor [Arcanobacterium haemolyticum]|nr:arginine repressor [Arcanobacterium haemolyticum]
MLEEFIPDTRSARQGRIIEILSSEEIASQTKLRDRLAEEGILVTQATLSRDLDELGAIKVKNAGGNQAYQVQDVPNPESPLQGARSFLERWASEVLTSVVQAGNQLILRTPPGAAQLLASSVDKAKLDGVIGTLGGDDTVLVITKDEASATALRTELARLT